MPWRRHRRGGREALPLLEAAVAARPDDLTRLESQGEVLGLLAPPRTKGWPPTSMVLASDPTRQTALEGAAHLRPRPAGTRMRSTSGSERSPSTLALRLPHRAGSRRASRLRDWHDRRPCLPARPAPKPIALLQVRKWLVQCYLHLGDRAAARKESDALLAFDPPIAMLSFAGSLLDDAPKPSPSRR